MMMINETDRSRMRNSCHIFIVLVLAATGKGQGQGQRVACTRSNYIVFHFHVNLEQNRTCCAMPACAYA